jgi:hypothetical protein
VGRTLDVSGAAGTLDASLDAGEEGWLAADAGGVGDLAASRADGVQGAGLLEMIVRTMRVGLEGSECLQHRLGECPGRGRGQRDPKQR